MDQPTLFDLSTIAPPPAPLPKSDPAWDEPETEISVDDSAWSQWESENPARIQIGDRLVWRATCIAVGWVEKISQKCKQTYKIQYSNGKTSWRSLKQLEGCSIENLSVGDRGYCRGYCRGCCRGTVIEVRFGTIEFEFDSGESFWIEPQHIFPAREAPITFAKTRQSPKGWIESQEKTVQGKRGLVTYTYHYYRYEIWVGGKLTRTPAIRIDPPKIEFVTQLIKQKLSVEEILELQEDWAK